AETIPCQQGEQPREEPASQLALTYEYFALQNLPLIGITSRVLCESLLEQCKGELPIGTHSSLVGHKLRATIGRTRNGHLLAQTRDLRPVDAGKRGAIPDDVAQTGVGIERSLTQDGTDIQSRAMQDRGAKICSVQACAGQRGVLQVGAGELGLA